MVDVVLQGFADVAMVWAAVGIAIAAVVLVADRLTWRRKRAV